MEFIVLLIGILIGLFMGCFICIMYFTGDEFFRVWAVSLLLMVIATVIVSFGKVLTWGVAIGLVVSIIALVLVQIDENKKYGR
jgi:hypothetical protein